MKKITQVLLCFSCFLQSCSIDDNGDMHITPLFWIILVCFVLLIIYVNSVTTKEQKELSEKMAKEGLKDSDFIATGGAIYVGGHPDIDQNFTDVYFRDLDGKLNFYFKPPLKYPAKKFSIPKEKISAIEIEDATSIEKKLTVGRIFLVGIFAFAWKKKKKNELAFVTIEWSDDKFKHTTIFNLEGKDAMQRANTLRNKFIKAVR